MALGNPGDSGHDQPRRDLTPHIPRLQGIATKRTHVITISDY